MRLSSRTSRKPLVVIRAVFAPRFSKTALVATVVPCATSLTVVPAASVVRSRCSIAFSTALSKSGGVEGTLWVQMFPLVSIRTTSVKVPPTSAPIRIVF